jgi:Lrp/AsnC family transcriptional regulator, leucine-responsive regulatory protein
MDLDDLDRRILAAVQADGRVSLTALAAAVHLGLSATRVRLQRLEESGVVASYGARVDAGALGYPLRAVLRLSVDGYQDVRVEAILAREPQVVRCLRVTGDICFLMEVVAVDMADLARITTEFARLGTLTTDLIYGVLREGAVPTR